MSLQYPARQFYQFLPGRLHEDRARNFFLIFIEFHDTYVITRIMEAICNALSPTNTLRLPAEGSASIESV